MSRDKRSKLLHHLLSTSSMTAVSRLFGMLRDIALASVFGGSVVSDAFVLAFRIPNLFRSFFAEGAFSQAFVPTLSKLKHTTPDMEQEFINNAFGLLALAAGLFSLLGSLFASDVAAVFAWGYSDTQQLALVSDLLRITFPYIFFISLTALAASVLQCHQHFFTPAFAPVLLNISMIFFTLVLADYFTVPIEAVAWSIIVAGVLQLAVQLIPLARIRRIPRLKPSMSNPHVKKMLILMLPIVISSSITQISMTIDSLLATFLDTGTVFWLYLGNRVAGLPIGVFGVSIAIIILPSLSKHIASENRQQYLRMLHWGIHLIFVIGLPASVALIIIAEPVVTLLFHYNQFHVRDVTHTAQALQVYALGLIGLMLIKVLVNAFLSHNDARTPVRCIVIASASNIVMSVVLMQYLDFIGLALATSISSLLNVVLLYCFGLRKGYTDFNRQVFPAMIRIVFACLVMAIVLLYLMVPTQEWLNDSILVRCWNMFVLVSAGMFSYAIALLASGWRWQQHRI